MDLARILSSIKRLIIPDKSVSVKILGGAFRGARMNLNLAHQTQLYLGLFERETYPWLSRFSKGVATAVDIGAAHGEYTIYFLKTTIAKVYTFEPDPMMLDRISSNLKLNP